jgi:hypothetical protein
MLQHLDHIKELIINNKVVSIISPNILGRSLYIPKELTKINCSCYVVVPDDNFIQLLRNNKYFDDINITYISSENMLKNILAKLSFPHCDVLIIEDLNNESINVNMIISLWMYEHTNNKKVPKLLICSDKESSFTELNSSIYPIDIKEQKLNIRYLQQNPESDETLYMKTAEYAYNIYTNNGYNIAIFSPEKNILVQNLRKFDPTIEIVYNFDGCASKGIKKIFIVDDKTCIFLNTYTIGCVIDTMIEKIKSKSFNGGVRSIYSLISKQKAKHRSCMFACTYYRMCNSKTYNELDEITPPEITRIPIHNNIIQLLENKLPPEEIIKHKNIEEEITLITNSDILSSQKLSLIKILPLSLRNSMFLSDWIIGGYSLYPGIVVASLIDCYFPSYFWFPRKNKSRENFDTFINKRRSDFISKYGGYNDLETSLNLWMSFFHKNIYSEQSVLQEWTYKNNLNHQKLNEVLKLVKKIINILTSQGLNIVVENFSIDDAVKLSKILLFPHYQDMLCIRISGNHYFNLKSKKYYFLDIKESINKFSTEYPEKILAIVINEIPQERNILNIIKFAIDVNITVPEITDDDAQKSVMDALEMLSKI